MSILDIFRKKPTHLETNFSFLCAVEMAAREIGQRQLLEAGTLENGEPLLGDPWDALTEAAFQIYHCFPTRRREEGPLSKREIRAFVMTYSLEDVNRRLAQR
jgi:hypothetical protein